jgi:hypothetical protein
MDIFFIAMLNSQILLKSASLRNSAVFKEKQKYNYDLLLRGLITFLEQLFGQEPVSHLGCVMRNYKLYDLFT